MTLDQKKQDSLCVDFPRPQHLYATKLAKVDSSFFYLLKIKEKCSEDEDAQRKGLLRTGPLPHSPPRPELPGPRSLLGPLCGSAVPVARIPGTRATPVPSPRAQSQEAESREDPGLKPGRSDLGWGSRHPHTWHQMFISVLSSLKQWILTTSERVRPRDGL